MKNMRPLPQGRRATLYSPLSSWAPLLLAAQVTLGCDWQRELPLQDLGNTSDHPAPSPGATGKARLNGRWVGQTKDPIVRVDGMPSDYVFPSGSRSVTLDLTFGEESLASGSIVFGAGAPPPPEAGVSYPPGVDYGLNFLQHIPPVEGLAYELGDDPLVEPDASEVATLTYERFQAFAGWCPLQPPVPHGDGAFSCVGGEGIGGTLTEQGFSCIKFLAGGAQEPVDCNVAALCTGGGPCACDALGCTQDLTLNRISIELDEDADALDVSFLDSVVDVGLPLAEPERLGEMRFTRETP